jgi:hypothetical protein
MMNNHSPHSRDELLDAFQRQESESVAYWSGFDTPTFFRRIGPSWSPAETVRHLIKATRPVVKALGLPRIVLRLMFGRPRRASVDYDGLCNRYSRLLAEGGQAGRFAPSAQTQPDPEAWRAEILRNFSRVNRELRGATARWPDGKLDTYQLPHPLLGKLTVREMLFFTLHHHGHHVDVVQRHLSDS